MKGPYVVYQLFLLPVAFGALEFEERLRLWWLPISPVVVRRSSGATSAPGGKQALEVIRKEHWLLPRLRWVPPGGTHPVSGRLGSSKFGLPKSPPGGQGLLKSDSLDLDLFACKRANSQVCRMSTSRRRNACIGTLCMHGGGWAIVCEAPGLFGLNPPPRRGSPSPGVLT